MGKAIETTTPKPILAADDQMHYLFEIQLMIDQIVGKASAENQTDYAWLVKTQHVRRYLVNYYREHAELPAGRRYLGMTRPLNIEVGMADFDVIRQKIRDESGTWHHQNVDNPAPAGNASGHALQSDNQPGQVIVDLQQARTRRAKKA